MFMQLNTCDVKLPNYRMRPAPSKDLDLCYAGLQNISLSIKQINFWQNKKDGHFKKWTQ